MRLSKINLHIIFHLSFVYSVTHFNLCVVIGYKQRVVIDWYLYHRNAPCLIASSDFV